MTKEQAQNEEKYKISLKMLNALLEQGLITKEEYDEINILNLETFSPKLKDLYV